MPSAGVSLATGAFGAFSNYVVLDPQALAEVLRSSDGMVTRHNLERGYRVKEAAQRLVGVRTGRLRDSIVTRVIQGEQGYDVQVGSEVYYSYWHHEGNTRGWAGNPFLTNALEQTPP